MPWRQHEYNPEPIEGEGTYNSHFRLRLTLKEYTLELDELDLAKAPQDPMNLIL